jgi:hypothetical protein
VSSLSLLYGFTHLSRWPVPYSIAAVMLLDYGPHAKEVFHLLRHATRVLFHKERPLVAANIYKLTSIVAHANFINQLSLVTYLSACCSWNSRSSLR